MTIIHWRRASCVPSHTLGASVNMRKSVGRIGVQRIRLNAAGYATTRRSRFVADPPCKPMLSVPGQRCLGAAAA
jgi:hypothetical protein